MEVAVADILSYGDQLSFWLGIKRTITGCTRCLDNLSYKMLFP